MTMVGGLTMSKRNEFVALAHKQVGIKERRTNRTKYGKWYGMDGQPWCAMFVSWCADQVGIPRTTIPKFAWTPSGYEWFRRRGQGRRVGRTTTGLKPGDIVFYWSRSTGRIGHVGIVYKVVSKTRVVTIEGNTSGGRGVDPDGGGVFLKYRTASQIYSVGQPDFADMYNVRDMQEGLNKVLALDPPLKVDGDYGPKTQAAVIKFQKSTGTLKVDGDYGPKTHAALTAALAKPKPKPKAKPEQRDTPNQQLDSELIKAWQRAMGTTVDGVIDRGDSELVRAVQAYLRKYGFIWVEVTGAWNRATWKAVELHLGVKPDGVMDGRLLTVLRKRLERGVF